ncbi:MAG: hypothetical protein IIV13_02465 [Bacteroidaceae bacterium]|nr:hypothetical protein [Bacteroidaceae bacterium]
MNSTFTRIFALLCALLILPGCTTAPTPIEAAPTNKIETWFLEQNTGYSIVEIISIADGSYALLATFTPPGVENDYTMIRSYIIQGHENEYEFETMKDAYAAGGAGFSVELLNTEDATILFGDIGSAVYDFGMDGLKDVVFTELIVSSGDQDVRVPIKNHTPYLCALDPSAEISELTYKTETEDVHYSDYYEAFPWDDN